MWFQYIVELQNFKFTLFFGGKLEGENLRTDLRTQMDGPNRGVYMSCFFNKNFNI